MGANFQLLLVWSYRICQITFIPIWIHLTSTSEYQAELPQEVNGEIVRGAGDCSEPVETMEHVAIPEEVSDALPSSSSSRSSIAEQSSEYWSMPNLTTLVRTHVTPRSALFVPITENCPIPLEWVDIFRRTETSLDHGELQEIDDYWTADARSTPRILEEEWIGTISVPDRS
jgi:hypothetical protein